MDLIYETHSTTTDNESGIATGWNDGELSEAGKQQAQALGARHRDAVPGLVVSSDLKRAVDTVSIAFDGYDVEIRADARLRECDYGDLNGAPTKLIDSERSQRVDVPFPNGESYRDVVERTRQFLDELPDTSRVVVVAHRAQYYALEHLLNGRNLSDVVAAEYVWRQGWRYQLTR